MANVTWLNPVSGDWSVGTFWSTGALPGTADTALIAVPGSYDVGIAAGETIGVGSVALSAATLTVNGQLSLEAAAGSTIAGSVTLLSQGEIAVGVAGASLQFVSGTFDNQGTVLAASGGNFTFNANPINLSTGTLTGGNWVLVGGTSGPLATMTFGSSPSLDGRIIVDAATITLNGERTLIQGYDTATPGFDSLENSLTSIAVGGVLNVIGDRNFTATTTLADAGTIGLGGGTLQTAALTLAAGGLLTGFGTIESPIADSGTISASGGALLLDGAISGNAILSIASNATLTTSGPLSSGVNIVFAGPGGVLGLATPTATAAGITGFALTDTIEAQGFDGNNPIWSAGTLTLTGINAQAGKTLTLNVAGSYGGGAVFSAVPDGSGGTDIGVSCFAAGTRILTGRGERAVETLRPGMLVPGRAGTMLRIRWVGHRRIAPGRHKRPQEVQPVRVRAGAFGDGLPRRDLRLSPDHAVYLPGPPAALVPVHTLLNGVSVVQESVRSITYYHVELETAQRETGQGETVHDVLLAEGLATESYLDTGNRAAFAGGGPALALHPDFSRSVWQARGLAALHLTGPEVVALRRRLLDRARGFGHARTEDPDLHVLADGARLPARVRSRLHLVVDAPAGLLRLASRTAVPALVRADDTDPRALGVAVARVTLDGTTLPLDDAAFEAGFYPIERDAAAGAGWRWTDGDARLRLRRPGRLAVSLAMTLPYWVVLPERGLSRVLDPA